MKIKKIVALALLLLLTVSAALPTAVYAAADETSETVEAMTEIEAEAKVTSSKAYACAIIIAAGAGLGALSMALASRKASEGIARQPEAAGEIRSSMMLSLVFIETAIIYALLVVIMLIFVL